MAFEYLKSTIKQFEYYKSLGDKTFAQLTDEQLFWQQHEDSNSIAVIVKHLWGNMLSRWTDFLNSDGEKPWRKRDEEFEADIKDRHELTQKWEEGWKCLLDTLHRLDDNDLEKIIYIRNQGHTVVEAINRQLAHYAYHVGQIVFVGRQLSDKKRASLSVPKGGSKAFNNDKFAKPKHMQHFTDEFLDGDSKA